MTNLRDHIRCWAEDNGRIGDLVSEVYQAGYKRGQECHQKSTRGDGLSGMRSFEKAMQGAGLCISQAPNGTRTLAKMTNTATNFGVSPELALACALLNTKPQELRWFLGGEKDRQAPQKATMHPDLEWLARRDPVELVTNCTGPEPIRYFKDDVGNVAVYRSIGLRLDGRPTFTRTEIEQARQHLALEAQQRIIERGQHLRELDEQRKAVLHPDNDPHIDAYVLGLNKLPDYETWFEAHGHESTTGNIIVPATVHELYTHFRARLLDELRQAGVIGEK